MERASAIHLSGPLQHPEGVYIEDGYPVGDVRVHHAFAERRARTASADGAPSNEERSVCAIHLPRTAMATRRAKHSPLGRECGWNGPYRLAVTMFEKLKQAV